MKDLTKLQLEGMETWDVDDMITARHRAAGALLVNMAVSEIRRRRTMEQRLEDWAKQLETEDSSPHSVGKFIAIELRNRMRGPTNE